MWIKGDDIQMTNKEKWLSLTDGLCSPQNMIDWGWRAIISASLQRRVWYGEPHMPCYPNMYTILYGEPGIGKSLVLDMVQDILKHHKRKDFNNTAGNTEAEKFVVQKTEQSNLELAEEGTIKSKNKGEVNEPTLFPYAPDATTYEALVESMSKSFRRINYTQINPDGTSKLAVYGHCSMYFCLDELGSLLRKKADSTVNYMLGLYGCPKEYEYKTKTSGEDRVLRGCLNFIAGTTPEFMEEISNDKLIGNGFSARCYFICATKNRKHVSRPPALTAEQLGYKAELLEHIKKLARLYGEAKVAPETIEWLQQWWHNVEENRNLRPNKSAKLIPYYARKNIHVYKVAMAEHFSESTDLFIPLETFQKAIEILDKEELTMHLALASDSGNPLSKVANKITDYIIKHKEVTLADLLVEFWDNLPQGNRSIDEILPHLIALDKIKEVVKETGERTYQPVL